MHCMLAMRPKFAVQNVGALNLWGTSSAELNTPKSSWLYMADVSIIWHRSMSSLSVLVAPHHSRRTARAVDQFKLRRLMADTAAGWCMIEEMMSALWQHDGRPQFARLFDRCHKWRRAVVKAPRYTGCVHARRPARTQWRQIVKRSAVNSSLGRLHDPDDAFAAASTPWVYWNSFLVLGNVYRPL